MAAASGEQRAWLAPGMGRAAMQAEGQRLTLSLAASLVVG
jgi:hypothetical protein